MNVTTDSSLHPAPLGDYPAPRPLDDAALDHIALSLSAASVVGIGESTRFAQETFAARAAIFRILVQRHGFRTLALQDSSTVGAAMDQFVLTGEGSAAAVLGAAWRPWRTAEMAAALEWIRDFNRDHAQDPVRIIGIKPAQAGPDDYDAVAAAVRTHASDRLPELSSHLDVIRTAHTLDEHVQRANGTHPGRRFADHAHDAAALLDALPTIPADARDRMRLIVEFHENSVAGRGSFVGDDAVWAETIIEHHRRTDLRTVLWDGIAHTSASGPDFGLTAGDGDNVSIGSVLREHFGPAYASVAIGFHHGNLGVAEVPAPAPDLVDAALGESALPALWMDLRTTPVPRPAALRTISGVYTPASDAAGRITVGSLSGAFDILIHFREVTPVRWLP
ncbi:erythromycin esterase [Nocardia sp. GAS34]|uniref:erythromycin esterase family protein n=1 Tax=unclassified Nocardia TaxID=2637762 RepID=UPI003D204BF0